MDQFAILATVVTAIVVPVTGMLVYLFKHVFDVVVPGNNTSMESIQKFWASELDKVNASHKDGLDDARQLWVQELGKDRELYKESLEKLSDDLVEFRSMTAKALDVINQTLVLHQKHFEMLLHDRK